jgi:uncharacterized Zn finger protein
VTENAAAKARRLLVEGRVRVLFADDDYLGAEVRGDTGRIYVAGFEDGAWFCDCPARSHCAHVRALMLIAVKGGR